MRTKRTFSSHPDYFFIVLIFLLVVFGFVMLMSASSDLARERFGDSYYYIKHQAIYGLTFGIIGFFLGYKIPLRIWKKYAVPLFIANIVLLLSVFTPLGISAGGANRWISLFGYSLQPGEFVKLTFLLYLSAWLAKNNTRGRNVAGGFAPFLFLSGGIALLLLLQPATSTAAVLFMSALVTYFVSGARFRFIIAAVLIALISFTSLVVATRDYRLDRIRSFLNRNTDELGKNFHINQSLLAIGSGKLTGVGFGKSIEKIRSLPEPIGDSIFAIIAQELGFIGAIVTILLFFMFVLKGFIIAKLTNDSFSQLLVIGSVFLIGFQAFVNIGAVSGVIPLTGIPLPFISFGGSALTVFLTMGGLIANVSKQRVTP